METRKYNGGLQAVKSGLMKIHSAAVRFGVPRRALSDRVKGKV
jgi:hypothetical protein